MIAKIKIFWGVDGNSLYTWMFQFKMKIKKILILTWKLVIEIVCLSTKGRSFHTLGAAALKDLPAVAVFH